VDGTDVNKSEWIKLESLMDPENPALGSKYSRQLVIFKDGSRMDAIPSGVDQVDDGLP
jgi:hypothetical protein